MPKQESIECSLCGVQVKDIYGHHKKKHQDLQLKCIHQDCENYPNNNYPTKNDLDLHIR